LMPLEEAGFKSKTGAIFLRINNNRKNKINQ